MLAITLLLFWLGLCFGSFAGVLVWRLHQQSKVKKTKDDGRYSIIRGRSMCEHCGHELAARDLVPLVSWLYLRGRCRYCRKPIGAQALLIELAAGSVFAISYLFWPDSLQASGQVLLFTTWLGVSVGLLALAVYDLKWYLLPNRIVYPTLYIALAGRLGYILLFDLTWPAIWSLIFSVAVASGVFWLIYVFSQGRLIGFGDVRLGWITGVVLASPRLSLLMIFLASLIGSLVAIPQLISGQKSATSRIPYGPFLILATWLSLLFGQELADWCTGILL